jgi:hypothetical protein
VNIYLPLSLLLLMCGTGIEPQNALVAFRERQDSRQSGDDRPDARTFKLVVISDGKLGNYWVKTFDIEAPNGHPLFWRRIFFRSTERAAQELSQSRKRAQEVLESVPAIDDTGRTVGQKVMGRFAKSELAKPPENLPHYTLFCTSGTDFNEVVAEHLDDLREFDDWLVHHSFRELMKDQPPTS